MFSLSIKMNRAKLPLHPPENPLLWPTWAGRDHLFPPSWSTCQHSGLRVRKVIRVVFSHFLRVFGSETKTGHFVNINVICGKWHPQQVKVFVKSGWCRWQFGRQKQTPDRPRCFCCSGPGRWSDPRRHAGYVGSWTGSWLHSQGWSWSETSWQMSDLGGLGAP